MIKKISDLIAVCENSDWIAALACVFVCENSDWIAVFGLFAKTANWSLCRWVCSVCFAYSLCLAYSKLFSQAKMWQLPIMILYTYNSLYIGPHGVIWHRYCGDSPGWYVPGQWTGWHLEFDESNPQWWYTHGQRITATVTITFET